jgi:hypothetical protein
MKPQIIAIEEHYCDPEMMAHFSACDSSKAPAIRERLDDLGDLRIKKMDEAGIHPGAGARRAVDAEPGCRHRLRFGAPGQRRAARCHSIASQATGGLRRAANGRSNSCDRRIGADRHEARVQGRDGSRAHQRPMVRRSLFLANLRASAGTRSPDLLAHALPASRRDGCHTEIAIQCGIDRLNVRSVLSRLEKDGARQTRRSFQDRHQSSAVITACGRALLEELDPNVLRTYEILLSSSSTLLFVARVM